MTVREKVPSSGPSVSAGLVSGFLEYVVHRGMNREDVLSRTGIKELEMGNADGRIALRKFLALVEVAKSSTRDPALVIHWAEEVGISGISIVGLVMEASRTMGDAFEQMQRYGRLVADIGDPSRGSRFQLERSDGKLFMVESHQPIQDLTEFAFAQLTCGPRKFLQQQHVLAVYFTHNAPANKEEYERIFACPVYFGAKWNALQLHPGIANWKVAQNPRYVFSVFTAHADRLLKSLRSRNTVRGRIENVLLPNLHEGKNSADEVATRMGYSRQTLYRKLKEERTSFTQVLDDLRLKLAKEYLASKKVSVAEVAYLTGFSEPGPFSRAFKRWTGLTPSAYQRGEYNDHNMETFNGDTQH